MLEAKSAWVTFHNPVVANLAQEGLSTPFQPLSAEALAAADAVVIATSHGSYDWEWIQTYSQCIVDTRHVLRSVKTRSVRGGCP